VNKKPTLLAILDGFGLAPASDSNAVSLAHTPNFDKYWTNHPHSQLLASGLQVGLPEGQMGNSEVGHLNLGAGRIVRQSLTHIDHLIETGDFFSNPALLDVCAHCKANQKSLHLMGLVSNGGVHSELGHVKALLNLARQQGLTDVFVHVFTDGRDTPPDSGRVFIQSLESELGSYRIATVIGRYYVMDRDNRWERVQTAYDCMVSRKANHTAVSASAAIEAAYARLETDEFVLPTLIEGGQAIEAGDGIVFFNFRADRAKQITKALMQKDEFTGFVREKLLSDIKYCSFMNYGLGYPYAFELPALNNCLAQVISELGLTQYHTAETEKYAHVTYFFNATIENPFTGEERGLVPSPKVATYDLAPAMSSVELTEKTRLRLLEQKDDFVLINFANPDMVGHTGIVEAAISACEATDLGLGVLVETVLQLGGQAVIVADHGNAEKMKDELGNPHTAHTTNPVPCIYVGPKNVQLINGILGDIAPTILSLMNIPQPPEMTGNSLIVAAP
jgi:2,3-bisphosphoglycerate-independent phosphoglycerate mutase